MARRSTLLLVAVAAALAAPQAGVGARANFVTFQMPSRNIGCLYVAPVLRCDILSGLVPEPFGSCELDWTGISLRVKGRARPTCAGDTAYDASAPILGYGRTWKRFGFTCLSRKTGLRCTNKVGRGFFLSRERWRVF